MLSQIHASLRRLGRRARMNDSGQGMTEYILIVALIAILSIGMVGFFGDNIRGLFQAAGNAIAGEQVDTGKIKQSNADTKRTVKNLQEYDNRP